MEKTSPGNKLMFKHLHFLFLYMTKPVLPVLTQFACVLCIILPDFIYLLNNKTKAIKIFFERQFPQASPSIRISYT